MNFVMRHWKLLLMIIAGLILLIWIGSVTGIGNKYFRMMLDNLRSDQSRIIEIQAENMRWYEETIASLQEEIDKVKKQQLQMKQENNRLKNELAMLQTQRESITVPDNPVDLTELFHKLGFRSIRIIRVPSDR